jgi:hypothetical protein
MVSFKFAETFISFFKPHPPMDNQATILLNPDYATPTSIFLIVLSKWGSEFCESNSDPNHFLSQIEVTCVMHNKMPNEPEHEYLVVETQDRLGKIKSLILERTVGSADNAQDISPGEGFLKLSKRLTVSHPTLHQWRKEPSPTPYLHYRLGTR